MTATPSTWWQPAYRGGRLEDLEVAECRQLLVVTNVGRLGYSAGDEQRIVVMNYVVTRDHIVVRTSSDNDTARFARDSQVAFEVDYVDADTQSGWSVLVSGIADELPRSWLRAMDVGETPQPWASGVRPLYLRVPLTRVTGRRVHPVEPE